MDSAPIVIIALLVAVGAGAVVVGDDILPGSDSGDAESFPTATPQETTQSSSGNDSDGSGTDGEATATPPPFAFAIENIEECGTTCRNVTSTLTNQQDSTAEEITVYSRIFAGREVQEDKEVWRGEEPVGTLDAGEPYTATRTVELSYQEALEVQNEDGWITIQTTVQTADQTITFTQQRQVL